VLFVCFVFCRLLDKGVKEYAKNENCPRLFKGFYLLIIVIFFVLGAICDDVVKLGWLIILSITDLVIYDLIIFLVYNNFLNEDVVEVK
jgi:hypothetical protein